MPEITCPCGGGCVVCRPADRAGGTAPEFAFPVAPSWPLRLIPFPPYETVYPSYASWYRIGREVPEAATVQVLTREVAREAERQQEAYARACAEQARTRTEVRDRAEQTLLRWLSPEQERDYREHQRFDVAGSDGRLWRILCQGQTGNVHLLDGQGEWTHAYCAHPRGLPDPAAWLAQAMAIAHDAAGFVRTANVYSTHAPREARDTAATWQPGPFSAVLRGIRPGWIRLKLKRIRQPGHDRGTPATRPG